MRTEHGHQYGDLPDLLDTLTAAVTTLDAVGVRGYRDAYLHVIGLTHGSTSRVLRLQSGRMVVGSPTPSIQLMAADAQVHTAPLSELMWLELCSILRIWRWDITALSRCLGCPEAMLAAWFLPGSTRADRLAFTRAADRINRLVLIDRARLAAGVHDACVPEWLGRRRDIFANQSIGRILQTDISGPLFAQIALWTLNSADRPHLLH